MSGYYSGAEEHFTHLKGGATAVPGNNTKVNYFDIANNTGTTLSHKGSGLAPHVIGTCPNAGPGQETMEAYNKVRNAVPDDDESSDFCHNGTFSVFLYGNETVRLIEQHPPSTPMYMYLAWVSDRARQALLRLVCSC